MRKILIIGGLVGFALLQGCAVNVVTVNVAESNLGYSDNATNLSSDIIESNVK